MVRADKVRVRVFVRVGGSVRCKARLVCTNKVRVWVLVTVGGSVRCAGGWSRLTR